MPEGQALYNANDGLTGRDGGPYLDLEEARDAEIKRAFVEGDRKPDLDNPPASAGIQLVTAKQALANAGVINLPSQAGNVDAEEAALLGVANSDDNNLRVHSYRPVEVEPKPAKKTAAAKK